MARYHSRWVQPLASVYRDDLVYEFPPPTQGVIALVKPRHYSLADVLASRNPLIVVLARLQDPGNVGTILRVAESFGATGCLATVGTASVLNSPAMK